MPSFHLLDDSSDNDLPVIDLTVTRIAVASIVTKAHACMVKDCVLW